MIPRCEETITFSSEHRDNDEQRPNIIEFHMTCLNAEGHSGQHGGHITGWPDNVYVMWD